MFLKFCLLYILSTLLSTTNASKVSAPYLKRCASREDRCPNEVEADIEMFYLAKGIPELGIQAAEPMFFKNMTMDQGHFTMFFPTMKVSGTRNCKITKFLRNTSDLTLTISFDCPFEATGKYKYHGTLFVFEIINEGKYKFVTDSVKTTITSKMEKYDADNGKSYWKLLDYDYSYESIDNLYIELDNLFKGSIGSSSPFLNFFHKKWWDHAVEVGDPMADAIVDNFYQVLKQFYLHVPIDELDCSE